METFSNSAYSHVVVRRLAQALGQNSSNDRARLTAYTTLTDQRSYFTLFPA